MSRVSSERPVCCFLKTLKSVIMSLFMPVLLFTNSTKRQPGRHWTCCARRSLRLKKANPNGINEKLGGNILKTFPDPRFWQLFCKPCPVTTISHLKNIFWPPAFFGGIGASFQILDNQRVACGLKLDPAAILNQNPIFEMPSNTKATRFYLQLQ